MIKPAAAVRLPTRVSVRGLKNTFHNQELDELWTWVCCWGTPRSACSGQKSFSRLIALLIQHTLSTFWPFLSRLRRSFSAEFGDNARPCPIARGAIDTTVRRQVSFRRSPSEPAYCAVSSPIGRTGPPFPGRPC